MQKIYFYSADRSFYFNHKKKLKAFISNLFLLEKKPLETVRYIFCSDEYLLKINKQFLNHNYYTDIITFELADKQNPTIAEIYISIDRVKENAITHSVSLEKELLRVIFHGALHLCGHKDKRKSEIIEMRKKEDQYLLLFNKFLL